MDHGLHHVLQRRRAGAARAFDHLMLVAGVAAPFALLPQILQVLQSRDVAGLSLITWSLLGGVNILWCVYGYLHREWPILIANFVSGALDFVIVAEIFLYR